MSTDEGSSRSEDYRIIPLFDATLDSWPLFEYKFLTFLDGRDLLHIIEDAKAVRDAYQANSSSTPKKKGDKDKVGDKEDENRRLIKQDKLVKSLLVNKIKDAVLPMILECKTAGDMMDRLRSRYRSSSAGSKLRCLDKLLHRQLADDGDIITHLAGIRQECADIKAAGGLEMESLAVVQMLRSMPKNTNWTPLINSLKSKPDEELSIDVVETILIEAAADFKHQRGVKKEGESNKTPMAFSLEEKPICKNCGKIGHEDAKCWAPGGGLEGKGPRWMMEKDKSGKKKDEDRKRASNVNFSFIASTQRSDVFYKDSGAGQHYCNRIEYFTRIEPCNETVTGVNGESIVISHKGSIEVEAIVSNGKTQIVELTEVRYAPKIIANLISTTALDKHGIEEHTKNGVTKFTHNGKEIFMARCVGNQWVMDIRPIINAKAHIAIGDDFWHRRLCHLSDRNMKRLEAMVDGYKYSGHDDTKCDVCQRSKIKRREFQRSTKPREKYPMDLIHIDFIVMKEKGVNDEKYALVLTDDCSSCRFAFPMKTRDGQEVLMNFKEWLPWAERQSQRTLKCIRHDNA